MNREDFVLQMIVWHTNNEHEQIIEAIGDLPKALVDFEIAGLYARALNNAGKYKEALKVLSAFEDEGKEDGVWNFRVGYSLYYLNDEAQAAEFFQKAIYYGDDADDTWDMWRYSKFEGRVRELIHEACQVIEDGERDVAIIQGKFDAMMEDIHAARKEILGDGADWVAYAREVMDGWTDSIIKHFKLDVEREALLRGFEAGADDLSSIAM